MKNIVYSLLSTTFSFTIMLSIFGLAGCHNPLDATDDGPTNPPVNHPPVFLNDTDIVETECLEGDTFRYVIHPSDPDGDSVGYATWVYLFSKENTYRETLLSDSVIHRGSNEDTIVCRITYQFGSACNINLQIFDPYIHNTSLTISVKITPEKHYGFAPFITGNSWKYKTEYFEYITCDYFIPKGTPSFTSYTILSADSPMVRIKVTDSRIAEDTFFVDTCYLFEDTVIVKGQHLRSHFLKDYFHRSQISSIICGDTTDTLGVHVSTLGTYTTAERGKVTSSDIAKSVQGIGLVQRIIFKPCIEYSQTDLYEYNGEEVNFFECLP
ncbi:MAG: hypothetical protein JW863_10625 [Chitinispirillaceae bacterium]|nr:hypothetical protein [Chitinispirillaceae bacterium]